MADPGPRRVGKTVLAQSLPDTEFLNCDLPSVAERLRDPERFYGSLKKKYVVFDEVHQLPDPSRLLKIGADAFPKLKILATGSSTLAATTKFRDSLTGRKRVVELVPVLYEELTAFGVVDLRDRLLRGGLPPALLAEKHNPEFYSEWLDSYYARDVQELFRLEKRAAFLRLLELLFRQSGGLLDVTRLAAESQVSRPTVANWLEVYQTTHVVRLLRPFSGGGKREILGQPKVFGFDTGLVCHARGWDHLRTDDCSVLWEHLVLETLVARRLATHSFLARQTASRGGLRGAARTGCCGRHRMQVERRCIRAARAGGIPRHLSKGQQLRRLPVVGSGLRAGAQRTQNHFPITK